MIRNHHRYTFSAEDKKQAFMRKLRLAGRPYKEWGNQVSICVTGMSEEEFRAVESMYRRIENN